MRILRVILLLCGVAGAHAQSIALPWSGHGHDPQHSGISKVASQPMTQIKWRMKIDLSLPNNPGFILVHYGAPVITRQNTLIVPVKTTNEGDFRIEARDAATGATKWTQTSDYVLPAHDWVPPFGIALTPKNRVYMPGLGGTVYFHDSPDTVGGTTGQMAFYGLTNYQNSPSAFNDNVIINTPITPDRYGNIYFGFQGGGGTTPALQHGIARIAEDGSGSWMAASSYADGESARVADNCAPALSNDQKAIYFAIITQSSIGYLVKVDSRTLQFISRVRLKDPWKTTQDSDVPQAGSATPTVGPDGDVYFGVLESSFPSHNDRGWLLHYDASLAQTKTPGSFGWDDTASIVPSSMVPSYHGTSDYLLLCKYNNYSGLGSGDGVNKVALLDPHDTQPDPIIPTVTVMKEVITVTSPTPSDEGGYAEWCINMAAIDPFTKSAIISCEDGNTYRWDFTTNTLSETVVLTDGAFEAYTPTMIGVDGTVFAIASGILFAIGASTP